MSHFPAKIVLIVGVLALVFALVGLVNSDLDTRVTLLVALFGAAIVLISVGARGAFPANKQKHSA